MEVHVHGGSKRKVELSAKTGRSKDVKKVRAALLGPGSSSGAKGPKAGLIELLDTVVHHDIEINLSETLVNSIDNMEPNALVKAMVEFCSKALILGRRVGSLYQRELKEGSRSRVEELTEELEVQADKHAEEKSAWKKAREEWLEEKKRLGTWKVRCLDLENKLKGRIAELEEQLRRKMVDWSWSWRTLKDINVSDARFDVNKDVVDGELVSEAGSSLEEEADKMGKGSDANIDDVMVVEDADEGTT
ncbi:hypothetical protein DEO72_LG9g1840 [Vigna unguiculata]|uniref:Uncharacterized protein n=1 Tax=Vigna unguiculata TaxID=3917 RepID=A0A4D6MZD5_VIGUN|nr:hypothetical protein DEO72_LG9g1840 [Vigna unguiculata]